jgi:dienelactone hydrolase
MTDSDAPLLGAYGGWIDGLTSQRRYEYSFLDRRWKDVETWRKEARKRFASLVLAEDLELPRAELLDSRIVDGLVVEELRWQLPYGPPTHAFFLKPAGAGGRLPAVLALHDHGGNKYFGKRKIADVDGNSHPHLKAYRELYYGGRAWANELAKRGYAVLVHDVFPFESRRILASDLPGLVVERMMRAPEDLRELSSSDTVSGYSCTDYDVMEGGTGVQIDRYNAFAGQHEAIVAKSLFSAGLTWPGVTLSEDRAALDYLASRPDVDPGRIGCGGLSGGGMRTNVLAGSDSRIRCSVTTGFMSTWADFARRSAFTHTWMLYIPGLSALMDYPDILAMRAGLPALVQATREDRLFDPAEVEAAATKLGAVWLKAGKPDNFRMSWFEGPHCFDATMQEEAFAWFDRWL